MASVDEAVVQLEGHIDVDADAHGGSKVSGLLDVQAGWDFGRLEPGREVQLQRGAQWHEVLRHRRVSRETQRPNQDSTTMKVAR